MSARWGSLLCRPQRICKKSALTIGGYIEVGVRGHVEGGPWHHGDVEPDKQDENTQIEPTVYFPPLLFFFIARFAEPPVLHSRNHWIAYRSTEARSASESTGESSRRAFSAALPRGTTRWPECPGMPRLHARRRRLAPPLSTAQNYP